MTTATTPPSDSSINILNMENIKKMVGSYTPPGKFYSHEGKYAYFQLADKHSDPKFKMATLQGNNLGLALAGFVSAMNCSGTFPQVVDYQLKVNIEKRDAYIFSNNAVFISFLCICGNMRGKGAVKEKIAHWKTCWESVSTLKGGAPISPPNVLYNPYSEISDSKEGKYKGDVLVSSAPVSPDFNCELLSTIISEQVPMDSIKVTEKGILVVNFTKGSNDARMVHAFFANPGSISNIRNWFDDEGDVSGDSPSLSSELISLNPVLVKWVNINFSKKPPLYFFRFLKN